MLKLYELLNHAVIAGEVSCLFLFRKDSTPGVLEIYFIDGCPMIDWYPKALYQDRRNKDHWAKETTLWRDHYDETSKEFEKLGLDPCDTQWCIDKESLEDLNEKLESLIKSRNLLETCVEVANEF